MNRINFEQCQKVPEHRVIIGLYHDIGVVIETLALLQVFPESFLKTGLLFPELVGKLAYFAVKVICVGTSAEVD